jgi:hypothetical protein
MTSARFEANTEEEPIHGHGGKRATLEDADGAHPLR